MAKQRKKTSTITEKSSNVSIIDKAQAFKTVTEGVINLAKASAIIVPLAVGAEVAMSSPKKIYKVFDVISKALEDNFSENKKKISTKDKPNLQKSLTKKST